MLGHGKYQRTPIETMGNGAALVVVNSQGSYWDYSIVDETIISALVHFGIPYRVHDLSKKRLTKEILEGCADIVLAQSRVGRFLTDQEQCLIVQMVNEGAGLVNFDEDLRNYCSTYLDMFGFDRINPHPYVTSILRIRNNEHYITQLQDPGECHVFNRMTTAIAVEKWSKNMQVLAEGHLGKEQLTYIRHLAPWSAFEPKEYPVIFAGQIGKGRAVQFTISSRMWRKEFFGHVRGADDLFYRSIIWTAKKPFITNIIPPFVTMSFDDCCGRHEFKYVDIAFDHGYVSMPSLFLDMVDTHLYRKIAEDQKSGKAGYNTHAISYYEQMYHSYGQGPLSADRLKEVFSKEDDFWRKVGVKPVKTVRCHCGEMGVNALPYLKERGRLLLNPALQTGILKAEMCMQDGYWPFNLQNCYYDYLPDDHDFYAFFSAGKRFHEDFLSGCTTYLMENDSLDMTKAAQNLKRNLDLQQRAGFYTDVITHEQKLENMSLLQWNEILAQADVLCKSYERLFVDHDYIGSYLKERDEVYFKHVSIGDGTINYKLCGKSNMVLRFSLYNNTEYGVTHDYEEAQPFWNPL